MARRDWLFTGGALSIDFVNTLRERWSDRPRETLVDPDDLAEWMRAAGLPLASDARGAAAHTDATHLRGSLEALFERRAEPEDLKRINSTASIAPRRQLITSPDGVGAGLSYAIGVTGALGLIAEDAIRLVAEGRLGRVATCQHERCALLFLDTSRGARRQWCSMQRCGNRMKAARLEQRRRDPAR